MVWYGPWGKTEKPSGSRPESLKILDRFRREIDDLRTRPPRRTPITSLRKARRRLGRAENEGRTTQPDG